MLFIELRLQVDDFFKDSLQSLAGYYNVHRTSKLRVRVFVEQAKFVLLLEMGRMKPKVWAGSVHLPVKYVVSS